MIASHAARFAARRVEQLETRGRSHALPKIVERPPVKVLTSVLLVLFGSKPDHLPDVFRLVRHRATTTHSRGEQAARCAYFEGQALGNTKTARGYSRDKRSDCKLVCIGLVCTPEGLPLNYEVFDGNRVDVTTVEDVVRKMEDRFGQAERIWVMDRGMVSEANIDFLRHRKALYVVGTPKAELRHFEAELAEEENWNVVQHGLEARLVEHQFGLHRFSQNLRELSPFAQQTTR